METILVTGGAGFIGSVLVRYIINHTDFSVVNVDKLTYAGNEKTLADINSNPRYSFECADICDAVGIRRILKQYQPFLVMHLAAESHVDRSIHGPDDFIKSNIIGTYTLLEESYAYWSCLPLEIRQKFRFHHVSTDEVYGDLPHPQNYKGSVNNLPKFKETTPYAPSSPYSASKASSDHLVRAWYCTYGLPVVVTNCSNNYGPYQHQEKLIPLVISRALANKPVPIYGAGNQIRDWLYVEDHVKALITVAIKGSLGETYNIGGMNEIQNIDVVRMICQLLDELKPKPNKYAELVQHVEDRPGHDMRYSIDCSKLRLNLGWHPQETFESGLRKTVQWCLNEWAKENVS